MTSPVTFGVAVELPDECRILAHTSHQIRKEIRSYTLQHGNHRIHGQDLESDLSFEDFNKEAQADLKLIRSIEIDLKGVSKVLDGCPSGKDGSCEAEMVALWLSHRLDFLIPPGNLQRVILKAKYCNDRCYRENDLYPGPELVSILGDVLYRMAGRHIHVEANVEGHRMY